MTAVGSGITPWRRSVGNEPTEARAVPSDDLVQGVHDWSCSEGAQHASERAGQPDFGKESHASSAVAGNGRAIAENEPPTVVARVLRNEGEQTVGLLIGKREQGQLFVSVKRGDDPRRPAAESSAAGIEQNWSRKWGDTGYGFGRHRAHVASIEARRRTSRLDEDSLSCHAGASGISQSATGGTSVARLGTAGIRDIQEEHRSVEFTIRGRQQG